MILLLGPCMFMAPLVLILIPIGIVLWPPTLLVLGITYLLLWPFAAIARRQGAVRLPAMHATLGRWFRTVLTPWTYFDEPDDSDESDTDGSGPTS